MLNFDEKTTKYQKKLIALAFYECNNNSAHAAKYLGLTYREFRYLRDKFKMNPNKGFNAVSYLLVTYGKAKEKIHN